MSKKHYQMIADMVKAMHVGIERHGDIVLKCTFPQWVGEWASRLAIDNPRFNRAKFFKACGVNDE